MVQPRLFELCNSGTSSCGLCRIERARSDSSPWLLHPHHLASHHRTRRLRRRGSTSGKDVSSWQRPRDQSLTQGEYGVGIAFGVPAYPGREVLRPKCSIGYTWDFCAVPEPSRLFETGQSGTSHSGNWALGNLQAVGDADGSVSSSLEEGAECQAYRRRSQSSYEAGILGIDSRLTEHGLTRRVSRIRSGRSHS